jgi:hypothetical protein
MDRKNLLILILAAVVLFLLFAPKASGFAPANGVAGYNLQSGNVVAEGQDAGGQYGTAAAVASTDYNSVDSVTSASLIPREVVATEDFGQFSPEKILTNQNYLDPRSQIGYPETIGGVLRNANRDIRSEPINPRSPVSIFNLSTIPPDTMRPKFEIGSEYN